MQRIAPGLWHWEAAHPEWEQSEPWAQDVSSYAIEYGADTIEIQADAIAPGRRVAVVDDLLATGGTIQAAIDLVRGQGGNVVAGACIIELEFLNGRSRVDVPFTAMASYRE